MEETRKRYVIQYTNPMNPGILIAIIMAVNKIEAKTLFIKEYPGCSINFMMEEN